MKKRNITIVISGIVALLATVLFTVLGNDDVLKTEAATISLEEVEDATIGDHGVGEIGHLAQSGGDNAVLVYDGDGLLSVGGGSVSRGFGIVESAGGHELGVGVIVGGALLSLYGEVAKAL